MPQAPGLVCVLPWHISLVRKRWCCLFNLIESKAEWKKLDSRAAASVQLSQGINTELQEPVKARVAAVVGVSQLNPR